MNEIKEYLNSLVYVDEIEAAKKILKLVKEEIDWDIKIQKKYLKNDFETDKRIHWRVAGMKALKIRLGLGL